MIWLPRAYMKAPVALHDADNTGFPNLALMKLSAWHKSKGREVQAYRPGVFYQQIHSSKVFTFTPAPEMPAFTSCGGTGWDFGVSLIDEIEHIRPDYRVYNKDFSLGFLTRGCPNKCPWCFVPKKEGDIRAHADVTEFLSHKDVVLMDNNVLACDHGIQQIEKMAGLNIRVDFNQGLDARRIDRNVAKRLSSLKWLKPLRLACDQKSQMEHIQKAVKHLRYYNCTPTRFFVYVLVKDIEDALERVMFLKGLGLDPFAQPYRDAQNSIEPTKEQRRFARWVNHKALFKSTTWEDIACGKIGTGTLAKKKRG